LFLRYHCDQDGNGFWQVKVGHYVVTWVKCVKVVQMFWLRSNMLRGSICYDLVEYVKVGYDFVMLWLRRMCEGGSICCDVGRMCEGGSICYDLVEYVKVGQYFMSWSNVLRWFSMLWLGWMG